MRDACISCGALGLDLGEQLGVELGYWLGLYWELGLDREGVGWWWGWE